MMGHDRESRGKFIRFHWWSHVLLLILMLPLGLPAWVVWGYAAYTILTTLMIGAAHRQLINHELRSEDEIWWLMCLGGMTAANQFKLDSLRELEKAEDAFEEQRSFQNMKDLQQAKAWHDIVLRAHKRASDSIAEVDRQQSEAFSGN